MADPFPFAICNETFGDWPLEQSCQFAADCGYRGWEVAPFMLTTDCRTLDATSRRSYRNTVEAHGLEIIGLHWLLAKTTGFHLTTMDSLVRKRTAEYLAELVKLCADLGGTVMVLGSPQQRNVSEGQSMESAINNAVQTLRDVVPALEKFQVRLAVEPLGPEEGNFLNHTTEGRDLIERVSSEQVKLHLDVKAMSSEGTSIPDIIRNHRDLMIHFHANDPNRRGPGMGEVDFVPILRTLKEIEYPGWVIVEVFDYSPGVEALVQESIANLRRDAPPN